MKKYVNCIVVIIIVMIIFPLLSTISLAKIEDDVIVGKFKYGSTFEEIDRNGVYYYSDNYFNESGKTLNSHLRTMSLNLALATFESTETNGDYSKGSQNASNLLNELNFKDIEINDDFKIKPTEETVGIIIGRKTINNKNLMVVSVRGVGYGAEWANNFTVGKEGYARGFEQSAEKVQDYIKYYQNKYNINDTKIWIMGYSRSSAIINIVGTKINQNLNEYHTTADDIYVYAFATPNSVPLETTKYANIHNTISKEDFFTYIPGKTWGLTRGGLDDTIIPTKGSNEYKNLYSEFKKQFEKIDNEREYSEDEFKEKYMTLVMGEEINFVISEIENSRTQAEFVDEFFKFLENEELFIGKNKLTREEYTEKLEPYAKNLITLFTGKTTEEQEEIIDFFTSVGMDIVTTIKKEVNEGNYTNVFYLLSVVLTPPESLQDEALEGMKVFINNSIERIEKPNALSGEDVNTIKNSIGPLVKYIQPVIYQDFMGKYGEDDENGENYTLRLMASIIDNINLLIQPHLPEVNLAWMRAMDTYYTTEGTISQKENAEDNYAEATLENFEPSELENLLSEEEKELVELGYDANIYLTVDKLNENEITNEEKVLINNAINSETEIGLYLDINLFKVIGKNEPVNISELDNKIKITITIPEELKGMDSYKIIRIHNNKVDILDTQIDGDKLIFETDSFSTYALAYTKASTEGDVEEDKKDEKSTIINNEDKTETKSPKTGDNIIKYVVLMLTSIIGICGCVIFIKKNDSDKK